MPTTVFSQFDISMQSLRQAYRIDETLCVDYLLQQAILSPEWNQKIQRQALDWMQNIRDSRLKQGGIDAFLAQYDLSSQEGIALMCLAEALLRIPDNTTAERLIRDKIVDQHWEEHLGKSPSKFVNTATLSLMLTGKILKPQDKNTNPMMSLLKTLTTRMGEPVIRTALKSAMSLLANQFVMAKNIESALQTAQKNEEQGYRYSFDMLGEAAKTAEDAEIYFKAYEHAIEQVGAANKTATRVENRTENRSENHPDNPRNATEAFGISVKLSALHPRYEWVNKERMIQELLPKLKQLAKRSMELNIQLTIDAEEADRLELSLLLIELLLQDERFRTWQGFGIAVQAYQKRAWYTIEWLQTLAEKLQQPLMVRLVKGAYWDTEIKYAEEKGYSDYPVFTLKAGTDVSFLACAKKLLTGTTLLFPQFATHNALTAAAVLEMAQGFNRNQFEFQSLQGMGDALYSNIVGTNKLNIPCRIYAPVGDHEVLLGYLVRRLLENGANTSFVNRILDKKTPLEVLLQDPVAKLEKLTAKRNVHIPLPKDLYEPQRANSSGVDLTNPNDIDPLLQQAKALASILLGQPIVTSSPQDVTRMFDDAYNAAHSWAATSPIERAQCLTNTANLLEKNKAKLLALLVREAGKTVQDSLSEIREAIDFCYYYGYRGQRDFKIKNLKSPTGEQNQLSLHGRGVMVCISPWNFPLAIFLGQITAALMAGNVVLAKPASFTPRIADFVVSLLHEAGFPKDNVQLCVGSSAKIAPVLLQHPHLAGVLFTGSTDSARSINQMLANREGPIVPLIAETGGQNVMIVDSSALPEQVVTDVLTSAFNSAGQRCSALRVLFVQQDIADRLLNMIKGAMAELTLGDPFELQVDVGPVIDKNAYDALEKHSHEMTQQAKLLFQCQPTEPLPLLPHGVFFAPRAFEISDIKQLKQEVFGPILHVIRYAEKDLENILDSINATGYGLTLGIHSRISERIDYITSRTRIGNTYVNRNMIGAVVGVQPFGGEGLSGTGPKAGGPHMLQRLAIERTVSINLTATGGNTDLLSLTEN